MANLYESAKRFFIFASIIVLASLASIGVGSVISIVANSPEQAQAMQVPILLPLMIFGGFFLNNQYVKISFYNIK
jgi:ABC-type multidrug transport system permease subunit